MISNLPPKNVPPETGGAVQGQPEQGSGNNYYGPGMYKGYPPPGFIARQPYYYGGVPKQNFPIWGWIILIVGAVMLFVAGLVTAILFFVANLPNVTESFGSATYFYNSLQRHDYENAHRMLTSELAGQYTITDLKTQWETLENANGGSISMDITNFNIQDDAATFSINLKANNGKKYPVTLSLHRIEGNTWRIIGASPGIIPSP